VASAALQGRRSAASYALIQAAGHSVDNALEARGVVRRVKEGKRLDSRA
jgi:hypothetical protein